MATIFAPRRFASCARVQKCRLETIGLEPQMRMSRASSKRSGSMPKDPPRVSRNPSLPAEEQMVRSSSDAPRRWKKRLPMDFHCT